MWTLDIRPHVVPPKLMCSCVLAGLCKQVQGAFTPVCGVIQPAGTVTRFGGRALCPFQACFSVLSLGIRAGGMQRPL